MKPILHGLLTNIQIRLWR